MKFGWQPIDTAPKDGTKIVCWAEGWDPCFLYWKTNTRIVEMRKRDPADMERYADSYFGDSQEWADYDLAIPGLGPTHWHPLEPTPK